MANLDVFIQPLRMLTPVVPRPTMVRQIVQAARDLCEGGRVLKEEQFIKGTDTNGQFMYSVTPSDSATVIFDYEDASYNKVPLLPTSLHKLAVQYPSWQTELGEPVWFTAAFKLTNGSVDLVVAPLAAEKELKITAVVQPRIDATDIPEYLVAQYYDAIFNGALGRIFNMKGQSWFDPESAAMYGSTFNEQISDAAVKAERGHTNKHTVVAYGGI